MARISSKQVSESQNRDLQNCAGQRCDQTVVHVVRCSLMITGTVSEVINHRKGDGGGKFGLTFARMLWWKGKLELKLARRKLNQPDLPRFQA